MEEKKEADVMKKPDIVLFSADGIRRDCMFLAVSLPGHQISMHWQRKVLPSAMPIVRALSAYLADVPI